ncbi:NAD-dependent epimerase/dehydratase family protein [Candidatus Woesearchaeota archaeon]|nr:NAD-dependent epimerase/dehydratase family protein [Candidatus Woesearchaeota archaeon]
MKKVVVFGAAGLVGSHLVDKFIEDGFKKDEIIAFDNLDWGKREYISDNATFVLGDITNKKEVEEVMKNTDAAFILSAVTRIPYSLEYPNKTIMVNVTGVLNILESAKKNLENGRNTKIIFASSGSVYGEPIHLPITEEHPLNPKNLYGWTKVMGEQLCRYYYEMFKISSICLRYSSIYGPRSSSDTVIPSFILNAIKGEPLIIKGDGTQKRQFSYVKDIVEGTSLAYKSDIEHDVFNINGGYTSLASIQEIAELVKTNVDNKNTNEVRIIKEEQRKGDITHPELAISIDKAKKRLGYEPKVNLPEGILKVEEWYKRRVEKFSRLI